MITEIDVRKVGSLHKLCLKLMEGEIKAPVMFIDGNIRVRVTEEDFVGFCKGMRVAAFLEGELFDSES